MKRWLPVSLALLLAFLLVASVLALGSSPAIYFTDNTTATGTSPNVTPMEAQLVGIMVGPANLGFVLVLPISDKIRRGRVHPASWVSLGVFVAFQIIVAPIALGETWISMVTN